jgi:hypothetical protein
MEVRGNVKEKVTAKEDGCVERKGLEVPLGG